MNLVLLPGRRWVAGLLLIAPLVARANPVFPLKAGASETDITPQAGYLIHVLNMTSSIPSRAWKIQIFGAEGA